SFQQVIDIEPRNSAALFYLGRIAYERNEFNDSIVMLNRATQSDPQLAEAWTLLTIAYLRRASGVDQTQARADYTNAVRA
ncbi:tetratricopeptide repeat protein, partial [Acinetobacter baumannii]